MLRLEMLPQNMRRMMTRATVLFGTGLTVLWSSDMTVWLRYYNSRMAS